MLTDFSAALVAVASAGQAYAAEAAQRAAIADWSAKDALTLAIAAIGAVLGIINTWATVSARKVRIVVKPTFAYGIDPRGRIAERPQVGIEVVNLSTFPVTVTEVGFTLIRRRDRAGSSNPIILDGKPWPRRLEAREAVSTYVEFPRERGVRAATVYADLATGERITYRGPFVKRLRDAMRADPE